MRTTRRLKSGDLVLVEGIESECTFETVLDRADERWGATVRGIVTTPAEGIREILCSQITHVLNINDGYGEHLVFNNDCYWFFNN